MIITPESSPPTINGATPLPSLQRGAPKSWVSQAYVQSAPQNTLLRIYCAWRRMLGHCESGRTTDRWPSLSIPYKPWLNYVLCPLCMSDNPIRHHDTFRGRYSSRL